MNYEEIKKWVESNADATLSLPRVRFTPDEIDHIATCIWHLYRHYHEGHPIGNFLSAVASNDLAEAVVRADDVNRKVLYLYILFIANRLPWKWVLARRESEKALRELQTAEKLKGEVALYGDEELG